MCYDFYMNKDVIYIEPEDDITDIITKIENAKQKIVALVPPKKAGVFRSVVNIKLITKAGASAKKTVVLVTTDPSIMKLAAVTKLPVTKDLQSAPTVPNEDIIAEEAKEDDSERDEDEEEMKGEEDDDNDKDKKVKGEVDDDEENGDDSSERNDDKKEKKIAKDKKSKKSFFTWIVDHKKTAIFSGVGAILLILVLVWALVIAPAVTVSVEIKTNVNNFSEAVTFTTNLDEENANEGKFYLEERKIEVVNKKEFEATGTKNVGEKAKGDVVVYAYFKDEGSLVINAGSTFTISGLNYTSDNNITLSWDGDGFEDCDNKNNSTQITKSGCQISGRVPVTAVAPGENYNIAASNSGWSTTADVGVYSDKAMSGGTNDMITIVSQSDVDKAKDEIESADEQENKDSLIKDLPDNLMPINASFAQKVGDAVVAPAIGEKVEGDTKPTITVVTTATIYVIDKTKIEEFIKEKAKLEEDQKIYEIKSPFIENFMKTDSGYTGKLKTSYAVGPKVTENDVVEIVKGKGLGEANHDLRDIDGVVNVKIDKSYPWVMSVPNDANKITVILEVKE